MDPAIGEWLAQHDDALVPIILYLADQPINRVKPELERRHAFRRMAIEANFEQASRSRDVGSIQSVVQADADFTLQFRREMLSTLKRESESAQREIESLLVGVSAQNIRSLYILNIMRADVPRAALTLLEQDPRIAEVAIEQQFDAQIANSTAALGAPTFWNLGYTGAGESVLILDSGINITHPAFGNRVRTGIFLEANAANCSTTERASPWDFQGHGSHVAGIIASAGTPGFPSYRGVAWGVSTIYSAKISCENGRSTEYDPLIAVQTALDTTPIRIVNNSNGAMTLFDDDWYSRRVDELVDLYDLTWVNAAGNSGPNGRTLLSPGIAYNVISVANVDTFGLVDRNLAQIARSSSRGPTWGGRFKPDVAAPGQNIWSMAHDSIGFAAKSGTSMAAPHIAGAAVLLRQRGVRDRLRIKALLLNTTDQAGWNADSGWGYANLTRAEAQADYGVDGRLSTATGSVQFFKGTVPGGSRLFATLVWNRFVRSGISYLRELDFTMYRQSDGQVLDSSNLTGQNVEQLVGPQRAVSTPVAIKVSAVNVGPGFTEPFAIALSESGFQPALGIDLASSCVLPASAAPSSVVAVNCTFRNNGDLPSFATSYNVGFVGGAVPTAVPVGPIAPGSSIVRTINVTAPATAGPSEILVMLTGAAYGVIATAADARYPLQIIVPNSLSISPASANVLSSSSTNTFSVIATPSTFAWTAVSNVAWISITGGSPGVGNGTVSYVVAPNTAVTPRTGTVTVAGRTFSVTQSSNAIPSATDSGPLTGSGVNQTLAFRFSHSQGFANLGILNVLINRALDGGNACYIAYSQPAGVLFLVNDGGPDAGLSAPLVLGSSATVSNSQCTIRGVGSSAIGTGTVLNLTLNISFAAAFGGSKVIYTAARDTGSGNSGWKTIGASHIPDVTPTLPRTDPLTPSTISTATQTITATYRSASGITTTWLLVNTAVNAGQACYIAYFAPGNLLLLFPDNGDAANVVAMPLTGSNIVENSQCRISAQGSTASLAGGVLTLSLNVSMKAAFSGPRGVWTALQDTAAQVSPWRIAGAWLVP